MRGRPSWLTSSADESAMSSSPGPGRGGVAPVPRRARAPAARPDASRSLALSGGGCAVADLPDGERLGPGGRPSPTRSSWPTYRDITETLPKRSGPADRCNGGSARGASVKVGSVASSHSTGGTVLHAHPPLARSSVMRGVRVAEVLAAQLDDEQERTLTALLVDEPSCGKVLASPRDH
jgi:hypothetical protein